MKLHTIPPAATAVTALFAFMAITLSARAELLVYEGFNYEVDATIAGKSGGSPVADYGWIGAWRFQSGKTGNENIIVAPTMTHAGVVTTGNAAKFQRTLSRTLATPVGGVSAGTVWCGFFIRPSESKSAATFIFSGSSTNLVVRFNNNGSFTGLTFGGQPTGLTGGTSKYFFLVRIDFGETGSTSYVWINPDLSGGEPSTDSAAATAEHTAPWSISSISMGTGAARYQEVDEIRIATTFREAVRATAHVNPATVVLLQ